MLSIVKLTAWLLLWGGTMFGALQISASSGDWGHGICGPWGCGPPTQALVSCHAFWFVLIAPPAALGVRSWSGDWLRLAGKSLTGLGVAGLIGIGIWEAVHWLPQIQEGYPTYFAQRLFFSVTTLIELPVVQILLVGVTFWFAGRRRSRTQQAESTGTSVASEVDRYDSAADDGETEEARVSA